MRAVLDTNVFISAFVIVGSQGEQALALARSGHFELCTSVAILTETARTLREKFDQDADDITEALRLISRAATVVLRTTTPLGVLHDEPDNRILECAVDAHADVIVTGDRHLLQLRTYDRIAIVRLADFLRMFPDTLSPRR
jgi:uncharacterized protein